MQHSQSVLTAGQVKAAAREVGFDLCGIAAPSLPPEDAARRRTWLRQGYHAAMGYMARNEEACANPALVLEGVRSVICCAIAYNAAAPKSIEAFAQEEQGHRVWISRYAWGSDYHTVMRRMLKVLAARLVRLCDPAPLRWRACVDTAPLSERALAAQAGLGWIGKNGALINGRFGSYLFLGELLVNRMVSSDASDGSDRSDRSDGSDAPGDSRAPNPNRCGDCRKCMDVCPGQAIVEPRMVDCRRCASYLTVEHRGDFTEAQRRCLARNVFGCDLCQDVCPWNREAPVTSRPEFQPREGLVHPQANDLRNIPPEDFPARFKDSPIQRCGYAGLQRNLAATNA